MRRMDVNAAVPLDALYKCTTAARTEPGYMYPILSPSVGAGASSRLHETLIKEKN